ncbi:MAG: hypothetical protein H0V01_08535 [Bacteroidetes bacterium]|nr:hypothetical protein [Bacteroidota bacterium]HET6245220.1 hypothetical protein [Bacteroidia bacterium]
MNSKINLNTLPLGIAVGLMGPILVLLAFYGIKFSHLTLMEFLKAFITNNVFVQLISLCVIINLFVFFIFIWTHRYYAARGVIMSTFIYTIGVVIYKFI